MSLTNPNLPVTEERLSEFYQSILPYLGGMPEAVCNKFDKANMYSTSEKIVGCWTDGKPVYQKTINFTTPTVKSGTATQEYAIGTTIDEIIDYNVVLCSSTYYYMKFSEINFGRQAVENKTIENGAINFRAYSNLHNLYPNTFRVQVSNTAYMDQPARVTIQYTKTTDAAGSFNIADENDYSTTEKIVGTWIDGKPVYQRCFVLTNSITLVPDQFLSISEVTIQNARNIKTQINMNSGGGNSFAIDAKIQDDHPSIRYTGSTSGLTLGEGTVLICQYTKTTD